PAVRAQCFALLGTLDRPTPDFLETSFTRENSSLVREQILRLSDQWRSDFIADTALGANERLRFQAVLSVGRNNSKPAWLVSHGQPWEEATTNTWMRAAILSVMD